MQTKRYEIWKDGEYTYPMACGFIPNLMSYLHEEADDQETSDVPNAREKARACVLVVPGGGYAIVSPTEGEIVAKKFYEKGYQAFVLTYTTNLLGNAPLKMQPLYDISRAVRYLRANAKQFGIDPKRLVLCGFSAGAHLCGSLCVHYEDVKEDNEYEMISNRPDAAILSYPVITSGEKAHRGSFDALLGADASEEELEYMSLEKWVTKQTPPIFLWQTATDETVPVENSYLMAKALKEKDVPFAHHVFPEGKHGLSLSNEEWEKGLFGMPYTMEQIQNIMRALKSGEVVLSKEQAEVLRQLQEMSKKQANATLPQRAASKEAAVWPELADTWIRNRLKNQ